MAKSVIGYRFEMYDGRDSKYVHLSIGIGSFRVKNALEEYQQAVSQIASDMEWRHARFKAIETNRTNRSLKWGKPGDYLCRETIDYPQVDIRWLGSKGRDSWYAPRVEYVQMDKGSLSLFQQIICQLRKVDLLNPCVDRPTPDDVECVLNDLKALRVSQWITESSGHFWLPVGDHPIPASPFKSKA